MLWIGSLLSSYWGFNQAKYSQLHMQCGTGRFMSDEFSTDFDLVNIIPEWGGCWLTKHNNFLYRVKVYSIECPLVSLDGVGHSRIILTLGSMGNLLWAWDSILQCKKHPPYTWLIVPAMWWVIFHHMLCALWEPDFITLCWTMGPVNLGIKLYDGNSSHSCLCALYILPLFCNNSLFLAES